MGLRAELAIADSSVVVADSDLSKIPELTRRTMRVVRQNLFLGFLLNAAGIALGVTDQLNPLFAAGAGFLSIFVVVGHALRRNPS